MMRVFAALLMSLLLGNPLFSQFITNGDGSLYDLTSLSNASGGVIVYDNGNYVINNDVNLSETDTLRIISSDTVYFDPGVLLRVEGVFQCMPADPLVFVAVDSSQGFTGITIDESNESIIENLHILFGGGIELIYSDVVIRNCLLYKTSSENGSGAINMLGSNPVIENNDIRFSYQAAIASSATSNSSPVIRNNVIFHNNTENGNRPQINLGTSNGTDDIVIYGNLIDGAYDEAGGISLATLAGGSISTVIDSNIVKNNRYGINVYGTVNAIISRNQIIDNNIEDDPMMGGSGISFYYGAEAMVYENVISGNLWGVTIIGGAVPNLGQVGDDTANTGHNYILENGNNGITYNLYNNTSGDIYAQNNYWGVETTEEAAIGIYDQADDNSLGEVLYEPIYILSSDARFISYGFSLADTTVQAEIDHDQGLIQAVLPSGTDITNLTPEFVLPPYAAAFVNSELQESGVSQHDFSNPVLYQVIAEDETLKEYGVQVITDSTAIKNRIASDINVWPVPVLDQLAISAKKTIKRVEIYYPSGELIGVWQPHKNQYSIPFHSYGDGLYILIISIQDGCTVTKKIIK